jgi:tRNA pseudouridine38-40 synthase
MTSRLVLEYDGGGFAGWARQPGQRTVQDEVERVLGVLLRPESGAVPVTVAGRTDTGVHAWAQVASYEDDAVDPRSLNSLLPPDVAVLDCNPAPDGFDARRDATSRAYCYRVLTRRPRSALLAGRVLHWPHPVDQDVLEECAAAVVGEHDFTAFTPTETDHVRFSRVVYAAFWRRRRAGTAVAGGAGGAGARGAPRSGAGGAPGAGAGAGRDPIGGSDLLEFWIEADSFMRHMNRVLVGTMLEVAGGRRSVASFVELLSGRPRSEAGPTASACGLYLAGVGYGGERLLAGS